MRASPNLKALGEKVRHFRKLAKMSQLALEVAIDTSQGAISRIENGEVNPTKETLLAIINYLKIDKASASDLLGIDIAAPRFDWKNTNGYFMNKALVESNIKYGIGPTVLNISYEIEAVVDQVNCFNYWLSYISGENYPRDGFATDIRKMTPTKELPGWNAKKPLGIPDNISSFSLPLSTTLNKGQRHNLSLQRLIYDTYVEVVPSVELTPHYHIITSGSQCKEFVLDMTLPINKRSKIVYLTFLIETLEHFHLYEKRILFSENNSELDLDNTGKVEITHSKNRVRIIWHNAKQLNFLDRLVFIWETSPV